MAFFTEHPEAAGVGGPSLPTIGGRWQSLLGELFGHPLATFSVRRRYSNRGALAPCGDEGLILANLALRRDAFLAVGGFDERFYPNEENELIERLQASGQALYRDPGLIVRRPHRPHCGALARQMFRYGRGRGEQARRCPSWRSWQQAGMGLALGTWAIAGWAVPMFGWPWMVYVAVLWTAAMDRAFERRRTSLIGLAPLFLLVHASYGVGVATGLARPRAESRDADVSVSRSTLTLGARSADLEEGRRGNSSHS